MASIQFSFSTKASNLLQLSAIDSDFRVPPFFSLGVESALNLTLPALEELSKPLSCESVIIRSSSGYEDRNGDSHAGVFESVGPVPSGDTGAVLAAILTISRNIQTIERTRWGDVNDLSEVVVQEYVPRVSTSGVVFTRDNAKDAPYYVINYDDVSGASDSVTAGRGVNANRSVYIFRDEVGAVRSARWKKLISAVQMLEIETGSNLLDIEFLIDASGQVHIVQLRPLFVSRDFAPVSDEAVGCQIRKLHSTLSEIYSEGSSTQLFGQMPDWNPAEIIGTNPRRLARELYEICVTDDAWAEGRQKLGYAAPTSTRLMKNFTGQPFIDVDASFSSFLPADLGADLGRKLIECWLNYLAENPELHDKVEFEVAFGEPRFSLRRNMEERFPGVFSQHELDVIEDRYKDLAEQWVDSQEDYFDWVDGEMAKLESAFVEFEDSTKGLGDIQSALQACKTYGCVPFSLVARLAFASRAMLLSLEETAYLQRGFVAREQSRIKTVATEYLESVPQATGPQHKEFMLRFGHLRPGTYDLRSPRYDQAFLQSGFTPSSRSTTSRTMPQVHPFLRAPEDESRGHVVRELENAMISSGEDIGIGSAQLLSLFRRSTVAREAVKLNFTRLLSAILEALAQLGSSVGLSRDDVSHISLKQLIQRHVEGAPIVRSYWDELVAKGREEFSTGLRIRLPAIIRSAEDAFVAPALVSRPNFFGSMTVGGEAVYLNPTLLAEEIDISGRIVLIENADPGYDWIFSHNLKGLVTKYGGANSHMAIRCVEFGLVAAIGVGDKLFSDFSQFSFLEIDPVQGTLRGA